MVHADTFVMAMGEDGRKKFSSFNFVSEDAKKDISPRREQLDIFYKRARKLTCHEFTFDHGGRLRKVFERRPLRGYVLFALCAATGRRRGGFEARVISRSAL